MSSQKIITVLGATGNQGGSVANTFLNKPNWHVRAITRNPSSPKAQKLASLGAQIVQANLDDPSTLASAFQGAHVVFAVSDFWSIYQTPENHDKPKPGQALNAWVAEQETQHLKNVIDVVVGVDTLERFIISSLSDASRWSGGKYNHVYHFDAKAHGVDYGKKTYPEFWEKKASVYQAGLFLSNFITDPVGKPVKNEQGVYQFISKLDPKAKLPYIAAEEDTGPFVEALVNDSPGKNLIAYRDWLNTNELVEAFTQATGKEAEVVTLPAGEWKIPFPEELQVELDEMFLYCNEYGYEGRDDPTIIYPGQLKNQPKLETTGDYFKKQDWA